MENEIENLQLTSSGVTKISKIIFYNKFPIFAIISKPEHISILGGGSIIDYLNNLTPYIDKIDLKSNKKLQLIIENRGEYLLL
jgi:hypothetical protein